ncbi:hypothetical protein JZ751_014135 [Albula glossodonta]|uniref:G-protein coupled receptors family 1 profile domain-containing protein n=1 Tax=Albula glossodonta TaxID=121402 RepID=A0A8T2P0J6_9TELE|nr:hypothetical protein JZ751_014135 [Albula glossodonta]
MNTSCDVNETMSRNASLATVYSLVLIAGLPLNGLSLWILLKRHRLKSTNTIFMTNLALSDLVLALSLPLRIYYHANAEWIFGAVVCALTTMLFRVNITSSSIFITFISVDRLLAVVFPLRSRTVRTPTFSVKHGLTSSNTVFMANLALSDLILALSLPLRIYYYASARWPFGAVTCTAAEMLLRINLYTSSVFVTFISVDRLLAVVFPLHSRTLRSTKYAAFATLYSLILFVGLPLNGLCLWILLKKHGLTSSNLVFMANLALCDFVLALSMPLRIHYYATGKWSFGPVACTITSLLFRFNIQSSAILITFISVDRLLAVVFPLRSRTIRVWGGGWGFWGGVEVAYDFLKTFAMVERRADLASYAPSRASLLYKKKSEARGEPLTSKTEMQNTSCDTSHFRYPLFTATYSLVLAFGLPLNVVSLRTLVSSLGLRSVPAIYMANLAVSDLLFILSLPFRIAYFATGKWSLGDVACMIPGTMFSVNLYSSSFFITLISVDRLLAVVYPIRSRLLRTRSMAWASCVVVWLAITSLAVPIALNHKSNKDKNCSVTRCFENYSNEEWQKGFYILCTVTALGILLPFTIISGSTISVIRSLRTDRASTEMIQRSKMIWMFVTNLFIYALCFIPFHISFILYGLYKLKFLQSSFFDAQTVTMCLASTNSCLDPIIYYFSIKSIQKQRKNEMNMDTMTMALS